MANVAKHLSPLLALVAATALASCALVPYEEQFACEATDDYGRCVSVQGAYHEALTGQAQGAKIRRKRSGDDNEAPRDGEINPAEAPSGEAGGEQSSYQSYRSSVYQKLKRMVKAPVTPMVKPPQIVRTLVLNYQSEMAGNPLFMHRYVYFFADEPSWVLDTPRPVQAEHVMPVLQGE